MPLVLSIPLSLALGLSVLTLSYLTGFPLAHVLVLFTGIWVGVDAERLRLQDHRTGLVHPVVAGVASVLLWPIAVPWYFHVRHRITSGALQPLRRCRSCGHAVLNPDAQG